ncbi:MAG: hypothetical protein LBC94_00290 [Desulfovibrio sp.]|jgi:hypothetical protein|nr:hypothetical protein [Desulfovibrio sp.]
MEDSSVAVIVDRQGKIASFPGNVLARIYHKRDGVWGCGRIVAFSPGAERGLPAVRDSLREFIADLGQTRILVAASISGIAYSLLNQRGFRLCEMDGFAPDCLDDLVESVKYEPAPVLSPHPEEISPGIYRCDLMVILREYPDLSSKKILRPFFDGTPFVELRLLCGHIPPWLAPELKARGLVHSDPVAADGKLLVSIRTA